MQAVGRGVANAQRSATALSSRVTSPSFPLPSSPSNSSKALSIEAASDATDRDSIKVELLNPALGSSLMRGGGGGVSSLSLGSATAEMDEEAERERVARNGVAVRKHEKHMTDVSRGADKAKQTAEKHNRELEEKIKRADPDWARRKDGDRDQIV